MKTRRVETGLYEVVDESESVIGIVYREGKGWQGQLLGCSETVSRYTQSRIADVTRLLTSAHERGGQRMVTLQPAPRPDAVTGDGEVLTQLPYPLHVRAFSGTVLDDWADRVIGFVADPDRQEVDLHWHRYVTGDPEAAVGMYVIIQNPGGGYVTLDTAVMKVEVSG